MNGSRSGNLRQLVVAFYKFCNHLIRDITVTYLYAIWIQILLFYTVM